MKRKLLAHVRRLMATLLTEQLTLGRIAAAVFVGIFCGIVPIYGLQMLAALGLAVVFRLNKPLTLACTFVNNPLLQPLLVVLSVELGYLARTGSFHAWHISALTGPHLREELTSWVMGSVILGVLVGTAGAAIAAALVGLSRLGDSGLRKQSLFVRQMFAHSASFDRGFVRWKLRLDRIFSLLAAEDLGSGTVVDLGCGYGMALSFAACSDTCRRLVGCDLNAHRIAVARDALSAMNAEVTVADVRCFQIPPAGLILILDVLQYLRAEEQITLLKQCCAALQPGGRLLFRVHDLEHGLRSTVTMGLDRMLFWSERTKTRPLMLLPEQYRSVLEDAGMQVETYRFRNRLPLAHILFRVKRPLVEAAP
ncbi:MAG TPA: DUF2062 domain-containing protein [Acidobacteriaceae bacterium]